jgi:C1A family cysteine protease
VDKVRFFLKIDVSLALKPPGEPYRRGMRYRIGRYGWIPDLPDARDRIFKLPRKASTLPQSVDLRPGCPPVYDQGDLGACTANAISAAVEFDQRKQKLQFFTPSRLFIYYNERALEGTISTDSGAMLRDGIKTMAREGVCPETMWPYDQSKFAERPSAQCYKSAKAHPAVQYSRVAQDPAQLKACLAAGYPFVLGFTIWC